MSSEITGLPGFGTENETWGEKQSRASQYIIAHVMIFIMSILGTAWSFIHMFVSGGTRQTPFKDCGFKFESWECAGYATSWISFWLISTVEMILWCLSWIGPAAFKAYMFWASYFGLWVAIGLYFIPLLFWIIAIPKENLTDTNSEVLWVLIVGSVMWIMNFLIHFFFMDGLI